MIEHGCICLIRNLSEIHSHLMNNNLMKLFDSRQYFVKKPNLIMENNLLVGLAIKSNPNSA